MKLLARSSTNEIVSFGDLQAISGGIRKGVKFYHLVDRTPLIHKNTLYGAKGFEFDQNSSRAGKEGIGIGQISQAHELAQYAFTKMKRWSFQNNGEAYTVTFDRVLDDSQVKCGNKFVYADIVAMLAPDNPHYTQFRGRLIILINSRTDAGDKMRTKTLPLLQTSGYFVVQVTLPFMICKKPKGGYPPAKLASLYEEIDIYLNTTPETEFLYKPGWCQGVRIAQGASGSGNHGNSGSLNFGTVKKKGFWGKLFSSKKKPVVKIG